MSSQRELRLNGGRDRIARTLEGHGEPIALRADLVAQVARHGAADDRAVRL